MGTWQFTPVAILYFVASVISFLLAWLAWRLRPIRAALPFSLMTASAGVWAAGYLLGFFNADPGFKLVMVRFEYLGATCLAFFWPVFVVSYVHPGLRFSERTLAALALIPALTFLQVLTFSHHSFFYRSYEFISEGGLVLSVKGYGPGFYIWAVFSWLVIIGGGAVFVRGIFAMPRPYRSQAFPVVVILVAMLIPNMLYVLGQNPFAPYDPTPLSFVVIGLSFLFAMWRSRLFDLVPVAHALVFREVSTGVLILDGPGRVLELNEAGTRILGVGAQSVTGRAVTDVLPEAEDLLEPASPANVKDRKREVKRGDRTYEMTTTSLSGRAGPGPEGRVIMLYDITARKQALERQAQLAAEARARARTLRGLLPICSACKRIRDDGGYWQEVEEYVREHSEAEFSHGMCPECAREYYGEALADEDPGSGSNPQD